MTQTARSKKEEAIVLLKEIRGSFETIPFDGEYHLRAVIIQEHILDLFDILYSVED